MLTTDEGRLFRRWKCARISRSNATFGTALALRRIWAISSMLLRPCQGNTVVPLRQRREISRTEAQCTTVACKRNSDILWQLGEGESSLCSLQDADRDFPSFPIDSKRNGLLQSRSSDRARFLLPVSSGGLYNDKSPDSRGGRGSLAAVG